MKILLLILSFWFLHSSVYADIKSNTFSDLQLLIYNYNTSYNVLKKQSILNRFCSLYKSNTSEVYSYYINIFAQDKCK